MKYEFKKDTEDIIKNASIYYFIQYHHEKDEHVPPQDNTAHPSIKYITDGSLINEIEDVSMKIKYKKKDKNTGDQNIFFDKQNIYDMIMIDEAHEHNKNMDFILSYLKNVIMNNNQMRLVILSATMDQDESKYRRYYRDVNDNRKYPLDMFIKKAKLDRINIDRRYHISPPEFKTLYKIIDNYEYRITSSEKKKIKVEDRILKIVKVILNESTYGDIIVFQPGVLEINRVLKKINESDDIPNDVIALPYMSILTENKRNYITKLTDESKKLLSIKKTDNFFEYKENYEQGGNYKRIIIVATNILEASTTINTAGFVIDGGTNKTKIYVAAKRTSKMIETNISESSRIQRRGRVGRKFNGTVYYLYKENAMLNNEIQYQIATSDIHIDIYNKLKGKDDNVELIDKKYDPNNKKNTKRMQNEYKNDKNDKSKIRDMIINQYYINGQYYDYFGHEYHYDYQNYVEQITCYETGYKIKDLIDHTGKFYFIHPNELDIKRNICGNIIEKKNINNRNIEIMWNNITKSRYLKSDKLDQFIKMLYNLGYIDIDEEKMDLYKTELGDYINRMRRITYKNENSEQDNTDNFLRSILMAKALYCEDDIIKLYAFYEGINYMLPYMALMMPGKNYRNLDSLNLNKNNCYSDNIQLINLLNEFNLFLSKRGFGLSISDKQYTQNITESSEHIHLMPFVEEIFSKHEDEYSDQLKEIKKIFTGANKWKNEKNKLSESLMKILNDKLLSNTDDSTKISEIDYWCKTRGLTNKCMEDYFKKYIRLKRLYAENDDEKNIDFVKKFRKKINNIGIIFNRDITPIDFSIFFGFCFNVCKKINESNYYAPLYNPSVSNIVLLKTDYMGKYLETFVNTTYLSKYILYLKFDLDGNKISIIQYISPKLISLMSHIYNSNNYNIQHKIVNDTKYMLKTVKENLTKDIAYTWEKNDFILRKKRSENNEKYGGNLQNAIINYSKTIEEIKHDLDMYYDKDLFDIMRFSKFAVCDVMDCKLRKKN
jgi:hypothetical protein